MQKSSWKESGWSGHGFLDEVLVEVKSFSVITIESAREGSF